MFNCDLDAESVTVIIALSAILSPILVSFIDNLFSLLMKILEIIREKAKADKYYSRGIFEDYLKYTGSYILNMNRENSDKYGMYYALALVYFPADLATKVRDLDKQIQLSEPRAFDMLSDLSQDIRKYLLK